MSKVKAAKAIRTCTIPPLVVTMLLVFLYFVRSEIFRNAWDLVLAIMFLAIVPTLAYPLQSVLPHYRDMDKREGQRKLAFLMSITGYITGFLLSVISGVSIELKFIYATYVLSVIILIIFNKGLKFRASGHACGVFGPLIHAVYFMGWGWLLPCALAVYAVVWSSLFLMRHTKGELLWGGISAATAFVVCILV